MTKQYFVWKDPNCNGINPEWIEMTPKEFYLFRKKPENRSRLFVILDDGGCDEAGVLIMEATKEYYDSWRKEYRAAQWRQKRNDAFGAVILSLDALLGTDDDLLGHDVVPADQESVETQVEHQMDLEQLREFLRTLSDDEKEVIDALFLQNPDCLGEREVARRLGVPRMTLNDAKKRIFKKYKK